LFVVVVVDSTAVKSVADFFLTQPFSLPFWSNPPNVSARLGSRGIENVSLCLSPTELTLRDKFQLAAALLERSKPRRRQSFVMACDSVSLAWADWNPCSTR
jgi:hypothetical protein